MKILAPILLAGSIIAVSLRCTPPHPVDKEKQWEGLSKIAAAQSKQWPHLIKNDLSPAKEWTGLGAKDLIKKLGPPPAQNSKETQEELAELLRLQESRTMAQVDSARDAQEITVFQFKDVFNSPLFTKDKLPQTKMLFDSALHYEAQIIDSLKSYWKRPRPYVADTRIQTILDKPVVTSYPSGHACAFSFMAVILSNMVPEKKSALAKKGWRFAEYRLLGGAHYRSDIEAGKKAGEIIAKEMFKHPDFRTAFDRAKIELRTVLGYELTL
jgi:acid phosphatase (class A)